jgi:hypothetical protein
VSLLPMFVDLRVPLLLVFIDLHAPPLPVFVDIHRSWTMPTHRRY